MTDRPPAERAGLEHNPKTCHICMNPNLHGEQAPDPLELENDRLREQVATLSAERDALEAALSVAADALEVHGIYIANFPDLDGCDSAHRALRAAVVAARGAIRARGAK